MVGIQSLAVLSLAAFAASQSIDGLDPCGTQCYTLALNDAGKYNCGASDMNCLCAVENWHFAIRDCASQDCPPGYMPTVTNAASALCATATLPPGTTPTETSAEETPTPTTTETPTTAAESSSEAPSSSSTTLETSTTATSSSTAAESSTASTSSTAVAPTKVATGTTSAASAAETSESPTAEPSSAGLTEAAKIGIGVGVGAAVIALLAVAACIFLRKRRERQVPPATLDRFKISHPMPSDEHAYTHNNHSEYDIGSGDLEMKSRRYEDMLPREEPRQMV